MNKKQISVLLITFVFICIISVNVFATTYYQTSVPQSNNVETTTVQTVVQPQTQQNVNSQEQNNQVQIIESTNNQQNIVNTDIQLKQQVEGDEALPTKQKTELLKMKNDSRTALAKYKEKYKNNAVYGIIAYILNMLRLASVPIFIVGYLISIVYEFIVGMKRREMVRKGRGMRITLGSAFVMAQILPLIFAIVIKFWGN